MFKYIILLLLYQAKAYNYILVPGMGGSVLYNEVNKKIWPPDLLMNFNDLHFKFDENYNPILPKIDNIGNLNDVRIDSKFTYLFTKNTYYSTLIYELEKNHNVYAFPYDFRFILIKKYYQTLFDEFNKFIENKDDIIFICHSMGGLIIHDFLNNYIKSKYLKKIKKIYYINVPFGGVPISFFAIYNSMIQNKEVSFNTLVSSQLLPFLTNKIKYLHHFGGLYLCLPIYQDPIFRKNDKWYNSNHLDELFINDPICMSNYVLFKNYHLHNRLKSINLDQTIIYSTNLTTSIFLDYDTKNILTSEGDGLVPIQSLLFPKKWRYKPKFIEISNLEHSKINNYLPLIKMLSSSSDNLII
jgi:hypothetical protein